MEKNRVVFDGETLIDLTNDTLTEESQLANGIVAHTQAGKVITGTNPYNVNNVGAAMEDILAALAEKGVTLTGTEDIDALAALIRAIETGGALPDGISALACGVYTPSSRVSNFAVTHNLGVKPNFGIVYMMDAPKPADMYNSSYNPIVTWNGIMYDYYGDTRFVSYTYLSGTSSTSFAFGGTRGSTTSYVVTDEEYTFASHVSNRVFTNAASYLWICGKADGIT